MPTIRPAMVLDQQLDLIKWWKSRSGLVYAKAWLKQRRERTGLGYLMDEQWTAYDLVDHEAAKLDRAETFWVSDPMCALVQDYAFRMPSQPLKPSDLPTASGFVWFDTPIQLAVADDDDRMDLRAVLWAPIDLQVGGDATPWAKEERGVVLSFYWETSEYEDRIKAHEMDTAGFKWPRLSMLNLVPWRFGTGWGDVKVGDPDEVADASVARAMQLMAAFWTISQQKLVSKRRDRDRATEKRSRRDGRSGRGRPKDDRGNPVFDVEVITLRRESEPKPKPVEGSGEGFEYSCWFMVEHHWHTYHYKDGPRQILLDDYPKGDTSKPFKPKADRVWAVRR